MRHQPQPAATRARYAGLRFPESPRERLSRREAIELAREAKEAREPLDVSRWIARNLATYAHLDPEEA